MMKAYDSLKAALIEARSQERETGERRYVVYSVADGGYVIDSRMPLCGGIEWYSADGIKRGAR